MRELMQLIESWKGGQNVHDQIHDQLIEMGYPTVAEYYFAKLDRNGIGPCCYKQPGSFEIVHFVGWVEDSGLDEMELMARNHYDCPF